jgi:hypothetical protein
MRERTVVELSGRGESIVCLRMPDVFETFDDTSRFWSYKLWIGSGVPIAISDQSHACAYVSFGDVVRSLIGILASINGVNIGFDEQPIIPEYL